MITILHGDDEVKVHAECVRLLDSAKKSGTQTVRIDGKSLTIEVLENSIGTQELFATKKLVVIDRLHSLPKSKLKDTFIKWIASHSDELIDIVLVENKLLTVTQLKQFSSANVQVFKLPQLLFSWIESLGMIPKDKLITQFHQILETQDAEFVFAMLIRQVRQLLLFVSDGSFSGPPFARGKLEKQARKFSEPQLLALHEKLLKIDMGQKTSRSTLTLPQEIDLFLASV